MSVNNKVPEIRFKGFSTNWLNFNLSQITDVYDGTHQTPAYIKSGVMFLSAENIKSLTSTKFISEEAFKKEFKVYPQKNDVLMTRIGDVGTANVVETDDDRAYYVTLALLKYKNLSPYFLKSSITSPFVQKDIWLRTLHIAFPKKINMNEIKQVTVNCPPDAIESDKIGHYFQKLDSLINQHQQKHDKLSNIKKTMLKKMFPKQGETIPEIRFKGFNGKWEYNVLQNICDVRDGTHSSPQYHQNGFPLVTSKNVKNGYINYDDTQCISKIDFDEINKRSRVDINDILMGMIGTIGNIALVREAPDFAIKNVALIKDKNIANFLYIYYSLQSQTITHQLDDSSSGGTQKFVSLSNIRELLTPLPKRKEQTAIGNYFQKLDTLINQHQQQITKLSNIKQACLSKMFV